MPSIITPHRGISTSTGTIPLDGVRAADVNVNVPELLGESVGDLSADSSGFQIITPFSSAAISSLHTVEADFSLATVGGELVPGPAAGIQTVPPVRVPRTNPEDLGLQSLRRNFPHAPGFAKALERVLELRNLSKVRNYHEFEDWVHRLEESTTSGTAIAGLRIPYKNWAKWVQIELSRALSEFYPEEEAETLAKALARWSEQWVLDEEHNYYTLEDWVHSLGYEGAFPSG